YGIVGAQSSGGSVRAASATDHFLHWLQKFLASFGEGGWLRRRIAVSKRPLLSRLQATDGQHFIEHRPDALVTSMAASRGRHREGNRAPIFRTFLAAAARYRPGTARPRAQPSCRGSP